MRNWLLLTGFQLEASLQRKSFKLTSTLRGFSNMHRWWSCQGRSRQVVSCPDYFSHTEGKNSLVNCLSNFCSMRFKNWWRNVFKNVLCDVTQSLKLRKNSKETACCRDHSSRSFRTPRNEDSQNMKPPSTSDSPETILSTFESLRNFTLPVFKLRNTHRPFTEVLAFLRRSFSGSTRLSLLQSASTA